MRNRGTTAEGSGKQTYAFSTLYEKTSPSKRREGRAPRAVLWSRPRVSWSLAGRGTAGRPPGAGRGPEGGAGAAGSIVVTAPRVLVTDGAVISSSTAGPGTGGSVMVTASDIVTLTGTTPTGAFASGIFAGARGTEGGLTRGGFLKIR